MVRKTARTKWLCDCHYNDGQNRYATHSACHSARQKDQRCRASMLRGQWRSRSVWTDLKATLKFMGIRQLTTNGFYNVCHDCKRKSNCYRCKRTSWKVMFSRVSVCSQLRRGLPCDQYLWCIRHPPTWDLGKPTTLLLTSGGRHWRSVRFVHSNLFTWGPTSFPSPPSIGTDIVVATETCTVGKWAVRFQLF